MKKYISLVILFLCSCILQGQEKVIILKKGEMPELKKGDYYKMPEVEEKGKPFEGVWEYKNGNEKLTIKIELKKTFIPKMDVYFDRLQLDYFYDKGDNNVVSNSTKEGYSKIGGGRNKTTASFGSFDVIKKKGIDIDLELIGENQVKMTLTNRPGGITVILPGEPKPKKDKTFSIPTDIILTKQNSSKVTE